MRFLGGLAATFSEAAAGFLRGRSIRPRTIRCPLALDCRRVELLLSAALLLVAALLGSIVLLSSNVLLGVA